MTEITLAVILTGRQGAGTHPGLIPEDGTCERMLPERPGRARN